MKLTISSWYLTVQIMQIVKYSCDEVIYSKLSFGRRLYGNNLSKPVSRG